eukprot:156608-Hanusia_phi.AAC.1
MPRRMTGTTKTELDRNFHQSGWGPIGMWGRGGVVRWFEGVALSLLKVSSLIKPTVILLRVKGVIGQEPRKQRLARSN